MAGHQPQRWLRTGVARAAAAALLLVAGGAAQAGLFDDDEARRAILEIRQHIDSNTQQITRLSGENTELRRSLLTLQNQIEALRADQATMRGANEQLQRDLSEAQKRQKDMAQGVDERLRQFEPAQVTVDGAQFNAAPAEKHGYEAALAVFRQGDFNAAQNAFGAFVQKYPNSGYLPSSLFWLGNAQYANRGYKEAIVSFKALLTQAPNHARAPEAALAIANCQAELKDSKAARKTLEDLMKAYPQSEAASAARERLARLK
ncbi:tol-pal system protein YbgF [Xylophilus rhododendri]|uniref:Cell division coordinator CpoB n=1 Tax=Xylophilus rhododendri TaxID=2697032 RepID=A0A857J1I7_9BURK|nr:tol-pal system protein YbgF [Xylophilus rhododendri]QHI97103.1 tol-pal system protein YbgF [Xylophilus rhododendri]